METVYRAVWKPRNKNFGISTNHIICKALYGDQDNIKYKLFELKCSYDYRYQIRETFAKLSNFSIFMLTVRYEPPSLSSFNGKNVELTWFIFILFFNCSFIFKSTKTVERSILMKWSSNSLAKFRPFFTSCKSKFGTHSFFPQYSLDLRRLDLRCSNKRRLCCL